MPHQPQELFASSATAHQSQGQSPTRKRPLSHSAGAFPQHLLQSDDEATSEDDDLDLDDDTASQSSTKRFRVSLSAPASPTTDASNSTAAPPAMTPPRKDALASAVVTASSSSRPNMSASHSITLEMLRPHFEEPLAQVAKTFGICVTLLKKICRKHGISRWPHRQITGLRKSIASMEHAIGYFEGARRDSYAEQLRKQKNKLALLLEDPTKCNPVLLPVPTPVSMSVSAPSSPSTAPLLHRHPAFLSVSGSSHASALPAFAAPSFDLQHTQHFHTAPTPSFHQPSVLSAPFQLLPPPQMQSSSHMSMSNLFLPPLRPESRRVLPSIASLVGGNGSSW